MRLLKLYLVFTCIVNAIGVVTIHDRFASMWALFGFVLSGCALYGIHQRLPLTWKLGFVWIGVSGCGFVIASLSTMRNSPDRRIVIPFIVVSAIAVVLYWGRWWYRQKGYFFAAISFERRR